MASLTQDRSVSGDRSTTDGVPAGAVLALGTGLFGLGLTVGGYGALVPVLVDAGVPAATAGAGTSLFLLGQAVAVLPADRIGRRVAPRTIASAGFLVAAVGAAMLATPTLATALVSRVLVGLGQGAAFVAAMTHVGRRTTGADTATAQGLLGAGFTLGFAVGLAATPTAIATVGPLVPAVVSAVVAGVGAAGSLRLPSSGEASVPSLLAYVRALQTPVAATLALGNAVTFGFLMVAGTWYADLLSGSSIPTTAALVGFALATVAGRAVGGVLAARFGDAATVGWSFVGQTVVLAGTAVAIAADRPLLLAAGVVLTGLGFGVPFGPLFALAFTEIAPDPGVTLVGMLVVGNLAALVYPWLVGRLLTDTGSFAVGIGAMAVSVGLASVLWLATVGTGSSGA
ncbi:MFS transporter [Haloarchaeobius sp. HRN-SO-5]|uniref:MFS transporter n=1 Tax=Haloarchaeobius sp. HRN-SO-5 TaxID=3446118 RepID=UPI003EB87F4C